MIPEKLLLYQTAFVFKIIPLIMLEQIKRMILFLKKILKKILRRYRRRIFLFETSNYIFKSSIAWSTVLTGLVLPSGSSILRLTRALFFIPTTLKRVLIALAVFPLRPITLPISAGSVLRVIRTPISSTFRSTLTAEGLSTIALTTYSRNSLSAILLVLNLAYFL